MPDRTTGTPRRVVAILLAIASLLASPAPLRAIPPEETQPYDITRALRELSDPALLESEANPPRRTILLSSADLPNRNPCGAYARQEPGERVLIDVAGPGVLTRFTTPLARGTFRFYVDDDKNPAWECEAWRIALPGKSPIWPEFIARTGYGGTIHAPILFAHSLKVTAIDGAADRWLAIVSLFDTAQAVRPWNPMSDDAPANYSTELETARRYWRGQPPPPRDPQIATVPPGASWTAPHDTLITTITSTSSEGIIALPANGASRQVPARLLFRGDKWGHRFDVPFLAPKNSTITAPESTALAIHGRPADERIARSAPRLFVLAQPRDHADISGVGRVLRLHAKGSLTATSTPASIRIDSPIFPDGFTVPALLDLAGTAPHEDGATTTGTLALNAEFSDESNPELYCDLGPTGIPFANNFAGLASPPDQARQMEAVWLGQIFPGPPAPIISVTPPPHEPTGRISCNTGVLDAGLPRPAPFSTTHPMPTFEATHAPEPPPRTAIAWTPESPTGPEIRFEDDQSIVLEVPSEFEPRPADQLVLDLSRTSPPAMLTTTFEPNAANEGVPVFPPFYADRRGVNGRVITDIPTDGTSSLTIPIGQNASWPGGRRDRIILRATVDQTPVTLPLSRATLRRAPQRPETPSPRWMPLLWDAKERVFGMYPATQVELRGQTLYDAITPLQSAPSTQLFPEWIPQLRLEHLTQAPYGPRVTIPVDPGPTPDAEPAIVFSATHAGETFELRHPALNGATALAIRFGNSPEGARVAVRDAATRLIACEDLFLNDRYLPARILAIPLTEPNPDEFITFQSCGPAPTSSGATIIVERILIDGPPSIRRPPSNLPHKPSRVLNPEPPRRPY